MRGNRSDRRRGARLWPFVLMLLALPAIAQFKPVPGREYRESFNPVNPVRGEAVVGLAIIPTEAAQRAGIIQVFLRHPFSGEIFVETATADGRFRGEGMYSGSSNGNEWISLTLISASAPAAGKERPVSPTALSIAVRGPGRTLYLARWGEAPAAGTSEQLRLYVNSRRAEMFLRAGPSAGAKVVRCVPVGVQQSVRFDSYCDLVMSDVPASGKVSLIRRDQFEEQTQALDLILP